MPSLFQAIQSLQKRGRLSDMLPLTHQRSKNLSAIRWRDVVKRPLCIALLGTMLYVAIFYLTQVNGKDMLRSDVSKSLEEIDMLKKPLNFYITANAIHVDVKNGTKNVKGLEVYYLEAFPPFKTKYRGDVLYLHGASFSSRTWNDGRPSVLQMTAAAGYHPIAIDLPGFRDSRTFGSITAAKEKFIEAVVEVFNITKPILISPSASGAYAVPFILKNQDDLSGFVAVAPCCVLKGVWEKFKVPTLIIHGSRDKAIISGELLKVPTKNLCIIPDAPHAVYTKKPMEYMQALVNFMDFIHPR